MDYDRPGYVRFRGHHLLPDSRHSPLWTRSTWVSKLLTDRVESEKVLLGFSARATAWQIDGEGNLVSGTPVYPTAETVAARLAQPDTETGWSDTYQQSYAIYTTEDGGRYFLWYQDGASIQAELRCAKALGVTGGVSLAAGHPAYICGLELEQSAGLKEVSYKDRDG